MYSCEKHGWTHLMKSCPTCEQLHERWVAAGAAISRPKTKADFADSLTFCKDLAEMLKSDNETLRSQLGIAREALEGGLYLTESEIAECIPESCTFGRELLQLKLKEKRDAVLAAIDASKALEGE